MLRTSRLIIVKIKTNIIAETNLILKTILKWMNKNVHQNKFIDHKNKENQQINDCEK